MTPGFYLSRLEARGRRRKTAVLEFKKGLNVVSGASDTGKSYVVQCLDFMTGASDPPERIDEAKGYESLWLEIRTWANEAYTLERSLIGGHFRLYACALSDIEDSDEGEILKEKNRTKANRTISDFLLQLCELSDINLLAKKGDGSKWVLKFRAVAHVLIIDEERIYTRKSPIHASGIILQKTMEQSLFRFLITGIDDSSLIAEPDQAHDDGSFRIRRETLAELIESMESDLSELTDSPAEVELQLSRILLSLDESTNAISLDRDQLRERQDQRRSSWETVESSSGRLEVLRRLTNRFALLEDYYSSDLRRLGAMSEAGDYLSQLPIAECPICGTDEPWGSDKDLGLLKRACRRESERIQLLQEDLGSTIEDISAEIGTLRSQINRARRRYERVGKQIEDQLLPSSEVRKSDLTELLSTRSKLERASTLIAQIAHMREQLNDLEAESVDKPSTTKIAKERKPKTSETAEFCKVVEKILSDWKFPDFGRVSFSESKLDLVINGKDRSSHGKGIRALSHAAFIVALLRYCRIEQRPYPGFVVLDSPLVAYREPDSKKDIAKSGVKENFYRSLTKNPSQQQVVVFENEDPPESVAEKIHYIHFSGDKDGSVRSGFFPLVSRKISTKRNKRSGA